MWRSLSDWDRTLFWLLFLLLQCRPRAGAAAGGGGEEPIPAPWPAQFHARLLTNLTSSGRLRNIIVMQWQLTEVMYDVEWGNGTTFYYTLGPAGSCRVEHFPVGILRPDFMADATYLGRVRTDGFLCDRWQKLGFIWYYQEVATKRPVRWDFYDGISMDVMTFDEGAVLNGPQWQAPAWCFADAGAGDGGGARRGLARAKEEEGSGGLRRLLRSFTATTLLLDHVRLSLFRLVFLVPTLSSVLEENPFQFQKYVVINVTTDVSRPPFFSSLSIILLEK
ncbi:unnamed protein product [Spirodela intermedia]|uniref:Uncharacterized protein n=1 Tax=Spirodela intermedia TaxID=51605 RepID=A0A7I8IR95_SPIIN|nr:unnamed protein product [Spirodela intermedia]CAA6660067.1 unnamed protein product [Spirodela intermedia]